MTTLIEDIQAVLNPLCAGGAWYGVNTAEPPTCPYITWQCIVSTTNNNFAGASDLQNTRIQIDMIARTVPELVALGAAVEAAMTAAPFGNVQASELDMYEAEIKAFRRTKDYSVWATN
jgi:hypothetical protein